MTVIMFIEQHTGLRRYRLETMKSYRRRARFWMAHRASIGTRDGLDAAAWAWGRPSHGAEVIEHPGRVTLVLRIPWLWSLVTLGLARRIARRRLEAAAFEWAVVGVEYTVR